MIYNYRSDEIVQDVILECFCPLIEDISDEYSTLRRYENLSIYAPSYIAREIIGKILDKIDDVWVHEESRSELLYKDDNEVIITIASDGMIFIENARTENGKLKCNHDYALTYVYDGFTKEDVDVLSENEDSILVFGFDEDAFEDEDDEDEEDEELEYDEDDESESETEHTYIVNGKPVDKDEFDEYVSKFKPVDSKDEEPVVTSTKIYRINGKEVDKETFNAAVSKIEDKYLDNVRGVLLGYCEIMDELNEWRKLLYC